MKTKKNKGFKKSLSFYRINFQFQQPYQLVLDGTFIKIMDDNAVDIDRVSLYMMLSNSSNTPRPNYGNTPQPAFSGN